MPDLLAAREIAHKPYKDLHISEYFKRKNLTACVTCAGAGTAERRWEFSSYGIASKLGSSVIVGNNDSCCER